MFIKNIKGYNSIDKEVFLSITDFLRVAYEDMNISGDDIEVDNYTVIIDKTYQDEIELYFMKDSNLDGIIYEDCIEVENLEYDEMFDIRFEEMESFKALFRWENTIDCINAGIE